MRLVRFLLLAFSCVVLVPSVAQAQASITGSVRDSSGAVLPGVTVEATSPALIEKLRTAVTDGTGQYRIVDLRPGVYSVTFTLPGFSVVRRDGVELTGSFTASIDAELRVGAVEETVTVTGVTPVVDVQSVRREVMVSNEVLTAIPTARSWAATALLIPSISTGGGTPMDIQVTPQQNLFGGAGGRSNEGRVLLDSLSVGASRGGAGVSTYIADIGNAEEVSLTSSGGMGEAAVGGPLISIVPRTGGNAFKGAAYLSFVPEAWVGSNYSEALRLAGLATPGSLLKQWDFSAGVGGPIKQDKLWYYVTARDEGQYRSIPGMYPNLNAGDNARWLYVPDTTKQAQGAESWTVLTARLTWQATRRDKFNFFWDEQRPCAGAVYLNTEDGCRDQPDDAFIGAIGLFGLTGTSAPETSGYWGPPAGHRVHQVTWSSPTTDRLLLEAGFGTFISKWGPQDTPGNPTKEMIRMNEQCAGGCANNGNIANLTYRSMNWAVGWAGTFTWRASLSYVTGAHNMKFGYNGGHLVDNFENFTNSQNLLYRVNNGVPNRLTQTMLPFKTLQDVDFMAFYAQEQWTRGRATLQGAVRYERVWGYFPPQTIGPTNFLPVAMSFERTVGVRGYNNLMPRGGLAFDLFGDRSTSLKVNAGQYVDPASNTSGNYSLANPVARVATTANRAWTDSNSNWVADCDLLNRAAQDNRAAGGDSCGALDNQNFGTANFSNTIDPAIMGGWNIRPADWQIGVSIQREVVPRVSVEFGYDRRWLQNFVVTDNRAVAASEFTPFSITAPSDPRLPGGGGYVVAGLYDVVPEKFGLTDNYVTDAKNYGEQYQIYNGLLLNVSARPRNGLTLQGSINAGKTVRDACEVRNNLPELTSNSPANVGPVVGQTNPYCRSDPGFVTRMTAFGSYIIPKIDVQIATTFRSDQGAVLSANYAVPAAVAAQALGRPLAGGLPNVTVNLVAPGEVWGDRANEFDLRVGKVLRFGRTRASIGVDLFNVFNSAAILMYNQAFVPNGTWLQPLSILTPRFVKFGAQIDF
jgi:hypothetical protein